MFSFYSNNPKMYVSVDCIIFGYNEGKLQILIQQRDFEPFVGEQSLMGGFVQEDEALDDAAKRVVYERTGLENVYLSQVGAFGKLDRDTAARVISICYFSIVNINDCDETLNRRYHGYWAEIDQLPQLIFDHNRMVEIALKELRHKIAYSPIAMGLLPDSFTLSQLQHVYEAVLNEQLDKRNFRKRLAEIPYIEETGEIDKFTSKRGARLFRFNNKTYNENKNFKI